MRVLGFGGWHTYSDSGAASNGYSRTHLDSDTSEANGYSCTHLDSDTSEANGYSCTHLDSYADTHCVPDLLAYSDHSGEVGLQRGAGGSSSGEGGLSGGAGGGSSGEDGLPGGGGGEGRLPRG